jgi:streptomycin 6-kinase
MRHLGDIARAMLEQVPWALGRVSDPADRRLLRDCAAAMREVAAEPGDRLLHWDLHYDNVLAADRAPGSPSTPSRWPATPASSCCPRSSTGTTPPTPADASTC